MKSRPIPFTDDMAVKANTGEKTETRRPFKEQPDWVADCRICPFKGSDLIECPYGVPGDELWVREAHYLYGEWETIGLTKTFLLKRRFRPDKTKGVQYPDDPPDEICTRKSEVGWFKRNSIFMPEWASRTTLTILDIRAERLQEITVDECRREGVVIGPELYQEPAEPIAMGMLILERFEKLWDVMYAKKPELQWDANPWVWRIEFERKEK